MESSSSLSSGLPSKFTQYLSSDPNNNSKSENSNSNSNLSQIFDKNKLKENPKALAQLVCFFFEKWKETEKISQDIHVLYNWAKEYKQDIPLHHFVKATCWYASWSSNWSKNEKNTTAFQEDLNKLLQQYNTDEDDVKRTQRAQKVAKVVQTNFSSLAPYLPSNIVTSSGEALPDILLFAESEYHRENGWKPAEWEECSPQTLQVAFSFCKTGTIRLSSSSTDKDNASLLWDVSLLSEKFDMDNLQKTCLVTFFSFFPYFQHFLENVQAKDVTKLTKFLTDNLYPSSSLPANLPFGPHVSAEANAEYFIDFHYSTDFGNVSEAGKTILITLRNWLTDHLESSYRKKELSLFSILQCLISWPSWMQEGKNKKKLFLTIIEQYTTETIKKIQSSRMQTDSNNNSIESMDIVEKELQANAKLIRKYFSQLENLLPKVSTSGTDDPKYQISPLLLLAENERVRTQGIFETAQGGKEEQSVNSWQIQGSAQALEDIVYMLERDVAPSFDTFERAWEVYQIADHDFMPQIKHLCQEQIFASEEFSTEVLTKVKEVSDLDFLQKCAKKTQNRFKDLEINLMHDHTWGIILHKWEFAQKTCLEKLGEHVTRIHLVKIQSWSQYSLKELGEKCPNIRAIVNRGIFLQESLANNCIRKMLEPLSKYFKNLKAFYLNVEKIGSFIHVCNPEDYNDRLSSEIPPFDIAFVDGKAAEANLADYPSLAEDHIDLFIQRPFRTVFSIDLTNCSHIAATQLKKLFQKYSFERISLKGCSQITDGTLRILQQNASKIKALDLSGTDTLNWESEVYTLLQKCTSLEELYLNNCPKISARLVSLKKWVPGQREVYTKFGKERKMHLDFPIQKLETKGCNFVPQSTLEKIFSKEMFPYAKTMVWHIEGRLCEIEYRSSDLDIHFTVHKDLQEAKELATQHNIATTILSDEEIGEIGVQDSSGTFTIDKEGFVECTIDQASSGGLFKAWNDLHNSKSWNRLNSVKIIDKNGVQGPKENEDNPLIRFIEKCTNITTFEIDSPLFTDEVASILPKVCPHLTKISICSLSYKGNEKNIARMATSFCQTLESFSLTGETDNGRWIERETIEEIVEACPKIRDLDLIDNWLVKDASLEKMAEFCPQMEKLNLQGCIGITDEGINTLINNSKKLLFLNVLGCKELSHKNILSLLETTSFTQESLLWHFGEEKKGWYVFPSLSELPEDVIMAEMSQKSHLPKKIRVKNCTQITDAFIEYLCKNKDDIQIQALDLRGCHQVTSQGIQQLVKECASIDSLFFSQNKNITDDTIQSIIENCPMLTCLVLENCQGISDQALKCIKNYNPSLDRLSLAGCDSITSQGILSLAKTCKKCKKIDLRGCSQLSGVAINALVQASKKHVQKVHLSGTNIRDRDVEAILASCKDLEVLDMDDCPNVSEEIRTAILQKHPDIRMTSSKIHDDNNNNSNIKNRGKMEEN